MAETAKKAATNKEAAKKGRARKSKTEKESKSEEIAQESVVVEEQVQEDTSVDSIREQVENCKNELAESLRNDIRSEYRLIVEKQVAKANRRRRWNNFFHDLIILALAAVVGYFGYCLYDARYFDFMKTECEKSGTCEEASNSSTNESAGPVKDATWYLANYSYLFENIQTYLSADNISGYYLYTDDRKVKQIPSEYLLSMAYNQVDTNLDPEADTVEVSEDAMKKAFQETFGTLELFEATNFAHNDLNFTYDKSNHTFKANRQASHSRRDQRKIVEQIERIYEEGEALYVLTTAVVLDTSDGNLYALDDLFQPIALNINESSIGLYTTLFNRYQYQFKKTDGKYYFSSIVKLR